MTVAAERDGRGCHTPLMPPLPHQGRPVDDVIRDLEAKRIADVRWEDGRTFGLVFDGGEEVREVARRRGGA